MKRTERVDDKSYKSNNNNNYNNNTILKKYVDKRDLSKS